MEAVGVVALVRYAVDHPELAGVQFAEAGAEVFAGRAVQTEAIAGFGFPGFDCIAQGLDNLDALLAQSCVIKQVLVVAIQRSNGFVNADKAQ